MADAEDQKPANVQHLRLVKYGAADTFQFATSGTGKESDSTVASNAALPEDEFQNFYMGGINDHGVIQPPWDMRRLEYLCNENNALMPCIDAMEVNIDGTGFDFESEDTEETEDAADDVKVTELKEFFDQPWPGMSFVTLRRLLRRDLERTGNGFIEVIRGSNREIVFLRHVDAKMVRLVKLDKAIPVKKTVMRNGIQKTITVMERQRRYVQLLNGLNLFFFKDFGVERDINKRTGTWADQGQQLPVKDRGTELIHFTVIEDVHTPYGLPRWIHQLPSIIGSRMAEEFNLEFFNSGGVPPALIFLQGGVLGHETRKALDQKTGGLAFKKNRLQILEVEPAGGTVDTSPQARVVVERFGAERQSDSMFEEYDDKCEVRVRRAFRLPPIFVGAAEDYSFATAYASYTVAEAQVFKPEREEFDEIISQRLLPAMGYDGYKMVSKPLDIADATLQMQGIEVAMGTGVVDEEDILDEVNKAVGTHLKVNPDKVEQMRQQADMQHSLNMNPEMPGEPKLDPKTGTLIPGQPTRPGFDPKNPLKGVPLTSVRAVGGVPSPKGPGKGSPTIQPPKAPQLKKPGMGLQKEEGWDGLTDLEKSEGLKALAMDTMLALRKREMVTVAKSLQLIASLPPENQHAFNTIMAELHYVDPSVDPDAMAKLATMTTAAIAGDQS